MTVHHSQLEVRTSGKGTYEITDHVRQVVRASDIRSGTVTVFVQHTSASLVIYENADPSARVDFHAWLERMAPEGDRSYTHTAEGRDDTTSHLRMALTRTSEVIPVVDGRLALGTWQGLFLCEHRNAPHARRLVVVVMGC